MSDAVEAARKVLRYEASFNDTVLVARALLAAVEGNALTPRDERAVTDNGRDAVIEECAVEAAMAAWHHGGEDAYSQGMDAGARHQVRECIKAIRALKAPSNDRGEARPSLSGREGEK